MERVVLNHRCNDTTANQPLMIPGHNTEKTYSRSIKGLALVLAQRQNENDLLLLLEFNHDIQAESESHVSKFTR